MNRRHILKAGVASAGLAAFSTLGQVRAATPGTSPASAEGSAEDRRLNTLFDAMLAEQLAHSPEMATGLGVDNGARAGAKARLDDRSLHAWEEAKARTARDLAALRKIDAAKLTGNNRWNHASILYSTQLNDTMNRTFATVGSPYVVTQLTGCYQQIPDFLDSQHTIANAADADAYLSRLDAFATAIDQDSQSVRHDSAAGVVPPDFILAKALTQLKALRDVPAAQSNLVSSITRRTAEQHIAGPWDARAQAIVAKRVQPALDRQIALLESLLPKAVHTAGVARLPKGEELYRLSLQSYTTSDMAPEEIHRTGLELIAQQSAQVDAILKSQGYTQGTVGQRLRGLYDDPKFRYPNTDAGKDKLLADLNRQVEAMEARLPQYFGTLPKTALNIRRVPKAIEAGAPGGYYQNGSLDGTRPGAYYINLRDTAEVPSWTLPTLTYHEGVPGHHLQLSLAQEAGLPTLRKIQFFSGYGEGWALYAEQLAVEMGVYENDPLGHVGQLHDSIFRAVRLVVDSGMHAKGWSREQAVKFYTDTIGDPETMAITEVERYCVWPGQACSYMLGKLDWLRLRDRARTALGDRFDIRKFHDAGLLPGAMPLPVLDQCIDAYIAAAKA
ncbi:DUF885 family protein [Novosphingobium sp. SG720]|uniref:DUF885 domain-containing protein n=1 Tax=Novosphingobium sp. SG720 TaxID=2586998 RepID=UPI00144701FE|nr:DUF885 family protein [Novosphingobium sp. SG720]NKJ44697.1 uncharacterized protein (DUF885 family) [Novosphingobium sp. SG720]